MKRLLRPRSRGQALVEFAFIFPIIAVLAFAFIDIGRAVFTQNTLGNAAREASRVASVNQLDPGAGPCGKCNSNKPVQDPSNPGWTFRGCALAAGKTAGLASNNISVSYAAPPGTDLTCSGRLTVGCIVTVTVVTNYAPITPVAGQLIGALTFTATSSMPIERLFP